MKSHFTAEFFVANRRRLLETTGCELIVVAGNGLVQRGGDNPFPFDQDANFWYLTGISEPDLLLVMNGIEAFIVVPGRSESRRAFDGSPSFADIQQISDVTVVYEEEVGWDKLARLLRKVKKVGTPAPPPSYIEQLGIYTNPARRQVLERIEQLEPEPKIIDISRSVWQLRARKQPIELLAIQQAIDITIESLQTVINAKNTYHYEYEIEADLSRGFRRRGAAGHAFAPIVAGGKRACTLHNVANNARLAKNELIILDVGAQIELYAADITRTISLNKSTKRQQAVHAAVLEVHDYACSLLKPGLLLKEYEQLVRECMGQQLQRLGLIKKISKDAVRRYYPHATSHFLGLNVHDVGEYDQPLEPNMVLTVEPGIYIPEEGIGVRVEDDIVITNKGNKTLSNKLSRRLV